MGNMVRGEITYVPPMTEVVEGTPKAYQAKKAIYRTYQVLWYILGVVEVLLGFRVVLKFLGANPASMFTQIIYQLSEPFAAPFRGIFSSSAVAGSVLEWSTIVGMIVYVIAVWGFIKLFQLVKPVTATEVVETVDSQ